MLHYGDWQSESFRLWLFCFIHSLFNRDFLQFVPAKSIVIGFGIEKNHKHFAKSIHKTWGSRVGYAHTRDEA